MELISLLHLIRRGYLEEETVSPQEAVDRALLGGEATEKDGKKVQIDGAWNFINSYAGVGFENLSVEDGEKIGKALHTIQDAVAHGGGVWMPLFKIIENPELSQYPWFPGGEHSTHDCTLAKDGANALEDTRTAMGIITGKRGQYTREEYNQREESHNNSEEDNHEDHEHE